MSSISNTMQVLRCPIIWVTSLRFSGLTIMFQANRSFLFPVPGFSLSMVVRRVFFASIWPSRSPLMRTRKPDMSTFLWTSPSSQPRHTCKQVPYLDTILAAGNQYNSEGIYNCHLYDVYLSEMWWENDTATVHSTDIPRYYLLYRHSKFGWHKMIGASGKNHHYVIA